MTGQTIAYYRVIAKIAAGGMGEVCRARDERLGREVALKVLPAPLTHNPDRLRRFEQEARSALNHPNIVTIYNLGHEQAKPEKHLEAARRDLPGQAGASAWLEGWECLPKERLKKRSRHRLQTLLAA